MLRTGLKVALSAVVLLCVDKVTASTNTTLLHAPKYTRLPYGAIKPYGWTLNMARVQADGLGGHLLDWYSYVNGSVWVGGALEYSEMQEAAPYWFNGMVTLAHQLNDKRLLGDIKVFLNHIYASQKSDGWFGPEAFNSALPRLLWPRYLAMLGLIQYAEADPTEFKPITNLIHAFVTNAAGVYARGELGNDSLGEQYAYTQVRWEEFVLVLQWLYDNDPRGRQAELIQLMDVARNAGYSWKNDFFVDDGVRFPREASVSATNTMHNHGVNLGESLKSEGLAWRWTGDQSDIQSSYDRINMTWKYHGRPQGIFSADEHLAGKEPSRGTELCTSVETMFSLETLYTLFGNPEWADTAERIAYNAFPAQNTPDFWSHQYLQQTNQIWAKDHTEGFAWQWAWPDNSYSNVFGLEPNYPCCTTNHPQGYPKFWAHSIVSGDKGTSLNHALLGPATLSTTLAQGNKVQVTIDTLYPFGSTLLYTVKATQSFTFNVRIPPWAKTTGRSSITVNKGKAQALKVDQTTSFQAIKIPAGTTTFEINLDMPLVIEKGLNNSIAVHRGPLFYAVDLAYADSSVPALRSPAPLGFIANLPNVTTDDKALHENHTHDHFLTYSTPWNIAIDPSTLAVHTSGATKMPLEVWGTGAQPVSLSAIACPIAWGLKDGDAAPPPVSPNACIGQTFNVTLRPFGGTRLRIGQIPTMKL